MKIDRLIGILSVLLQREKTTAPELAERFEVSRRTINRDIEDLCRAGIPIRTSQGTGGGISIMDGYRMDRTILTSKDMQMILAGLRSLDSVSGSSYYDPRRSAEPGQRERQQLLRSADGEDPGRFLFVYKRKRFHPDRSVFLVSGVSDA